MGGADIDLEDALKPDNCQRLAATVTHVRKLTIDGRSERAGDKSRSYPSHPCQ